jgi:Mlc titration factor MtfA (ptsG expression regulator)
MLIYPQTIRRDARYKMGGPGIGERHVIGEAWHEGAVVLSWPAVLEDCRDSEAIANVVIHEMAHQIDRIDGEMAGSPPMPTRDAAERWEHVAAREFERLQAAADMGQPHLLDVYGAESRAEFFAVSTETFYREPHAFATHLGELYNLLMELYRVDPRQWF